MNRILRKLLLVVFLLYNIINSPLDALNRFEHLAVEDGLAHTDVTAVVQDYTGLMWFGTNSGLQSYDGYNLQLFDYYKNSNTRFRGFHNRITSLATFNQTLFVGTKNGILVFCLRKHTFKNVKLPRESNLSSSDIKLVHVDSYGNVLIKTSAKIFLAKYDANNETIDVVDSMSVFYDNIGTQEFFSIQSVDKSIWLFSAINILKISIESNKLNVDKVYPTQNFLPVGQFINNAICQNNKLYIRTEQGCLRVELNKQTKEPLFQTSKYVEFSKYIQNIPQKTSGKITVDANETLWVISQNGLIEINKPFSEPKGQLHKKVFEDPRSISTNFLSNLFVDKNNNLWIGTWGGGVNFLSFNNPLFNLIKYTPKSNFTLNDQFVKAVDKDADGTLWILTQKGGLNHYDINRGLLKDYDFADSQISNKVFKDLQISPDGTIIFVATIEGLIEFNKLTGKSRFIIGRYGNALLNNNTHIYSLDVDNFGNLWVGTWDKGLFCLNIKQRDYYIINHFNNVNTKIKMSSNLVSYVYSDNSNNEIFVCSDNGLNRLILDKNGAVIKNTIYKSNETNPNSFTNNFLSGIDKQNDTTYWVGTLGGGLNQLTLNRTTDAYSVKSYLMQDGLLSDNVEIVLVDNDNNVWFSANGLTKFDTKNNTFTTYDYRDGLQGNSFKIGAGFKDKEGNLYFGGIYGLNFFNPQSINPKDLDSEIIISNLYIHGKLVEAGDILNKRVVLNNKINEIDKIKLRYNENNLALSFSALNYWTTSRVRYRYKLIGFNSDWQVLPGTQNSVNFSNLTHGNYKFEIQVSFDGGVNWNEKSRKLQIIVMPPWWLSIYAKLFYVLLISYILYLIFQFYNREMKMKHMLEIKELEERNIEYNHQLKLQFFMNISHEFKTPLTLILSAIERLNINNHYSLEHNSMYESISRNANKLLALITELMDFRKTDIGKDVLHLTHDDISIYINQIIDEFGSWANKYNVSIVENLQSVKMNFDKEKIAKIVSNLLSNAIKYSPVGGTIEVSVAVGLVNDIKHSYSEMHSEYNEIPQGQCCLITVRDQGVGVTKESLSRIFDRFFQVESKTSMHLGSGIGLAVAKNMVLSHKAIIYVSSDRNVGTEFIVALPLDLQKDESHEFDESAFDVTRYIEDQYLEFSDEKIDGLCACNDVDLDNNDKPVLLIIEDNLELLYSLKQYFSINYCVLTAENGKQGLEICKERYPDLIVSDVMMPEMSGVELCVAVRENLSIAYTPIILLTAKSDVEYQLEGYGAGADLYIPKPFSLKLLEINIQRLIANRKNIQSKSISTSFDDEIESNERGAIIDQKEKEFVSKLIRLVNENLEDTDFSVEKLCRELGVGRTKLYTKVKDITGQALGDLIRDVRLNKAAHLLRTTDLNITEVIYQVGFGSNSHFSKSFKARFGVTPTEYAKQNE